MFETNGLTIICRLQRYVYMPNEHCNKLLAVILKPDFMTAIRKWRYIQFAILQIGKLENRLRLHTGTRTKRKRVMRVCVFSVTIGTSYVTPLRVEYIISTLEYGFLIKEIN